MSSDEDNESTSPMDIVVDDDNNGEEEEEVPNVSEEDEETKRRENLTIQTANAIHDLATQTIEAIETYIDPSNEESEKVWSTDPTPMYDHMEKAGDEMTEIWKKHYEEEDKIKAEADDIDEKAFHSAYMDFMTSAFADELDALRKGKLHEIKDESKSSSNKKKKKKKKQSSNSEDRAILEQDNIILPDEEDIDESTTDEVIDIDILSKMLETGMETWSLADKKLLLEEVNGNKKQGGLTPHERRRRLLLEADEELYKIPY